MPDGYTHKSLAEVKDMAPEFGLSESGEARFASEDLEGEETGVTHLKLKSGKRQPFAHKHDEAEEVYVVLSGSGRIKLDDDIVEITELDAIRISPEVVRQLEAGEDGLEVLAFGPRHKGDGEMIQEWWTD